MSKFYTIEEIERLTKEKKPIDMNKLSFEVLNPTAYKYCEELKKARSFSREMYLKCVNDNTQTAEWRLENGLKAIQLLDFAQNSIEGIEFNWTKTKNSFSTYNENLKNPPNQVKIVPLNNEEKKKS